MKSWDQAGIELMTPGLAVRLASVARHITDCAKRSGYYIGGTRLTSILRKKIEGYLDSISSLTFNTIKTKPIMHAFHSSTYMQSKWMLDFSHTSMVHAQYISKWCNPPY